MNILKFIALLILFLCCSIQGVFADNIKMEIMFDDLTIDVMKKSFPEHKEYDINYPQIKNPSNEAQENWNQIIYSRFIKGVDSYCDGRAPEGATSSFDILFASKNIISLRVKDWYYCGGAHGLGGTSYKSFDISAQEVRVLELHEIFGAEEKWKEGVLSSVLNHLISKALRSPTKEQQKYISDRVKKSVEKYGLETGAISRQGIEVNFGFIDGYAGGEYIAQVPWSELKPYITPEFSQKMGLKP